MGKTKLLFAITQFFKGGAETALLNLFCALSPDDYTADFVLLNQLDIPGALSLVEKIPGWVNVVDAAHLLSGGAEVRQAPSDKAVQRLLQKRVGQQRYHWAFHVGEWSSPTFVATGIVADHKAVWVHSELDAANYFDPVAFFKWYAYFERYIFVSQSALAKSTERYPQLLAKGLCIHNLVDITAIRTLAQQPLGEDERYYKKGLPVVLTCANVRAEKNHLRQLEAMALLKSRGLDFYWLNIGALPDEALAGMVREKARQWGLAHRFLLLGSRDNPYPYMQQANAVAVLSDYESWSMVITEALLLGRLVVATKTSGALAQITAENGLLADFTPEAIADGLQKALARAPAPALPAGEGTPPPKQAGLAEFEALVRPAPGKKRVLYVMDDINYPSGVQKATFAQMDALKAHYDITLYSPVAAEEETLRTCPCRQFLQPGIHQRVPHFYLRGGHVLTGHFSRAEKLAKARQIFQTLTGRGAAYEEALAAQALRALMETFDAVVVPSEGSALRGLVASLNHPKKIQWIHTDYAGWREFDAFSKTASQNDAALYQRFNAIITISARCRQGFVDIHPHLAEKTLVIRNLLPRAAILQRAGAHNWFAVSGGALRLITIGRLHAEKNHMALLQTASRLLERGIAFQWYMVGDGPQKPAMQQYIEANGLAACVCLTGQLTNVYPLLAQMDAFVLFSHYEGTPVTIEEALLLGVPVVARPVGGIPDLVQNGANGLFANDEDDLLEALVSLGQDAEQLARLKEGAAQTPKSEENSLAQLGRLLG